MKILIFSDSHGNTEAMHRWIAEEKPTTILHLGDHYRDLPEAVRVPGNCDPYALSSREKTIELGGVRIYLTHGHLHGVKSGLEKLHEAAKEKRARIALFGHTHIPYCAEREGVLLLNPGSAGSARSQGSSGIVLELGDVLHVRFLGELAGSLGSTFEKEVR